ncbi:glycosyltransferase family 4 protein [Cohaesibacter haloalkalitolerans]|uniref:glycosyltransferase family 4 protein n=1 Tax=Cohaesibacter haloalkalitolerans TaxID=1162980 RepID=UPI000E653A7D|nr:glycosyltransferase family 4 protein [Cohaesibacter haloalkalitolerans]
MQAMDSATNSDQTRKTLLFFAPEVQDAAILNAYEIYLHHLSHSELFDITIMAPNGSPFGEEARTMGYRMYPVSDFSRKLLLRTPQLWPILTATRRFRFDYAICHEAFGCRGLSHIARKVIGVCHDDMYEGFKNASRMVAITSSLAEEAKAHFEGQVPVDVLPYPYECQFTEITPLPEGDDAPLTIGASGPFLEGDGLGIFIHAAQLLHQSSPDARFVIAGQGPLEHELKELSDHIAPFIDFAGPMDASEMAEAFDIYCLAASNAPYSVPLCQMMDAGIACVSTCASGPMDILKGGMVAPLVPMSDSFLLAVKLQELLEDRPQIERIKKACFDRIREEDFSPRIFEEKLISLFGMEQKAFSRID